MIRQVLDVRQVRFFVYGEHFTKYRFGDFLPALLVFKRLGVIFHSPSNGPGQFVLKLLSVQKSRRGRFDYDISLHHLSTLPPRGSLTTPLPQALSARHPAPLLACFSPRP